MKQQLHTRDFHLEAYEFSNADTDDVLLTLDADATDFPKVETAIGLGFDNPLAWEYRELLNSLRKLASIKKASYYKQPDYLGRLMQVSQEEGWEMKIVNGKILIEVETMELLLKLLNNDRLRSPINNKLFDSAAKKTVGGKVGV